MKTISGHYDTAFSIAHNNRDFIPCNADPNRTFLNYECVAAGHSIPRELDSPMNLSVFWERYRELSNTYWEDRAIAKKRAYEEFQKHLILMKEWRRFTNLITDDGISALLSLLFLPILIPCGVYMNIQMLHAKEEYENMRYTQWLYDKEFRSAQLTLREAIKEQDKLDGTAYLQIVDSIVKEMAHKANDYIALSKDISTPKATTVRFATLEEIYDKLFEPSFREFQDKQRPCRRYNGTYLESIREGQKKDSKKRPQSKNARRRKPAEAIEIVFGIGDMDNTGYEKARPDAERAAMLLKDFCDHLMEDPKLCAVTTRDLEDPNWRPPFKNGLIVLNLTVHCDEATPGVHLTCIPYSCGCKRGPTVQATMGRAFTGMGYPSTWTNVLDDAGNPIPKRSRQGEIIYNEDGSIRCQQRPDKQGIIDWIEDQKAWLQKEMLRRYNWSREYKGSHSRGNLSTPDYKVARAKERGEIFKKEAEKEICNYSNRVRSLSIELQNSTRSLSEDGTITDKILYYIKYCSKNDYEKLANEAKFFWDKFALQQEQKMFDRLKDRLQEAQKRTKKQTTITKTQTNMPTHNPSR